MVKIELMSKENSKDLFKFEKDNKTYFENMLQKRLKDYFEYATFFQLMENLLSEQASVPCLLSEI